MAVVKTNECVSLTYSGYANDVLFDSNVPEQLQKLNPQATAEPSVVIVGGGMLVKGLDDALIGKEYGKQYTITLQPSQAFGMRRMDLVKTLPLKVFTDKNVHPRAGMALTLDDSLVKIIAVSGARVVADFNNPLANKVIRYDFTVTQQITDEQQRARATLQTVFKFIPSFIVRDNKVIVQLPQALEQFVMMQQERFTKLMGKPLGFEVKALEQKAV